MQDRDLSLFTDLYELTMVRAYWAEGMEDQATFSMYARSLPEGRNYFLAAGLGPTLRHLENFTFTDESLEYLEGRDEFDDTFIERLSDFEFTGSVRAVAEGTPVFPNEPLIEVTAPIAEAQLAETIVMNQIHFATVVASKAARIVEAAGNRDVIDFGPRRMHGTDAGLKAARAFYIAGVAATSNVLAGQKYGVPITGTMAHSYIQAHDSERDAFERFSETFPETVLLVDTYDTLEGVDKVIELAEARGSDFAVRGIRLDSGDLGDLARRSRKKLDDAGLENVEIFASGGLDEYSIARLVEADAPIDGFGVGTSMGVARDAPALDIAYKLVEYAGSGRLKLSPGKKILPGPKQVYRIENDDCADYDVLARSREDFSGRPLLRSVMQNGEITDPEAFDLNASRERAERLIARLPERIRSIESPRDPYEVRVSQSLQDHQEEIIERIRRIHEEDN